MPPGYPNQPAASTVFDTHSFLATNTWLAVNYAEFPNTLYKRNCKGESYAKVEFRLLRQTDFEFVFVPC
jgi:hypothetical protein